MGKKKVIKVSKKEEVKKAVLWTRVSTKEQAENNLSLDTQEKACVEYAEKHNIEIVKEFGKTNESAKKEGKLFKEMIHYVARHKTINTILAYSFDRFSRAGIEGIITKQYLKSKGVTVISVTQPTDPDSVVGEFMENIIFLFNEFENNLRRDKCIAGMIETLENGDWYSRPPLGFTKTPTTEKKKHIIKVNETGELIRKAFKWKATEEISNTEILERLKREGLKLDKQRLTEIFHNPFYCGKIQHYYLGDRIVKGNQEVLIDEETFNKVNGITTHRHYEHSTVTPDFPLKRHVKCGECGRLMTGYKSKGKAYYKCNTDGCSNNHSADKLHRLYAEILDSFKIPNEYIPVFTAILKQVFNDANKNKQNLKKDLTKRETECKKQIDDVNIRYGLGQINEEVYSITIKALKTQQSEIEEGLEESKENLSNLTKFVSEAITSVCELGKLWQKGSFEQCQKLQQFVHPEGVVWKRESQNYLTEITNTFLECVSSVSDICKNENIKKSEIHERISDVVAGGGLEPPTFGL